MRPTQCSRTQSKRSRRRFQTRHRIALPIVPATKMANRETDMTSPTTVEQANQPSPPQHERDQLQVHLQGQLNGRGCDFRAAPRGRGLILRGRSRSYYGKQSAQHAVMEAVILPIVANESDLAAR